MRHQLHRHDVTEGGRHPAERPARERHPHREERTGGCGLGQIVEQPRPGLRRADLKDSREHPQGGRDDEGMRHDLAHHTHGKAQHRAAAPRGCHQRRRQHEMHHVFEAEDDRHGNCRRLAECQECERRSHVADIAIGAGKPLHRGLVEPSARGEEPEDEGRNQDREGHPDIGRDEAPGGQLLHRRLGDQIEEEGRQRDVDHEGGEPAEFLGRPTGQQGGADADQDQPEKG